MMGAQLCTAIGRVAWGYVFYYISFNVGVNGSGLDLLPDWACYLLVLSALPGLAHAGRSALLLRPLALILFAAEAVKWCLALLGAAPEGGYMYLVNALISVVSLYFHFQLLTNVAAAAEGCGSARAAGIRRLRNFMTVLSTVLALLPALGFYERLHGDAETAAALLAVAAVLVMVVWTLAVLFGLRRELREAEERGADGI